MADTAWNHQVYSCPHEFYSCGYVSFISTKSSSVIVVAFKKTKLLPFASPDHDTNAQACLATTQMPLGTKSEETEEIYTASMAPV